MSVSFTSSIRAPTLEDARACLLRHFGYPDFRPPQIRAVESVIAGRDTLIVLPTGGGKSLCYQVPALMREGLTVVVSPLISLMKDQVDALARRGLSAAFINSTLGVSAVSDRMARANDGSLKMLYLSPERLENEQGIAQLRRIGVALLAVDEAHCISEWGHDFRPSYRRLGQVRQQLGDPQTVALTATATPEVRHDIVRQLALRDAEVVVAGFDRTNLAYHVIATRTEREKDRAAVQWIQRESGPAIVYAPTRKMVERTAAVLVQSRINAVAYHAGQDERLRQRAQDAFMHGRARVIVATSAFGMGIDKPDVRLVVHHAMPGTLESYYQEAGRAGRDGKPSTCVLLHCYADRFTHEYFIHGSHPDRDVVEKTWRALRSAADTEGFVHLSVEQLANLLPRKLGERVVGAAIRTLTASGALSAVAEAQGRVHVRLLATPSRIAAEFGEQLNLEREVLRTLWRAVGRRLMEGATIDLDGLPPGFGGASGVVPVLQRLETGQYLTWQRTGGGLKLHERSRDSAWMPVNWDALARRQRAELARLDAMQRYAQCRTCRRAFVLRYFGDTTAMSRCDACDRCIGCNDVGAERARTPSRPGA